MVSRGIAADASEIDLQMYINESLVYPGTVPIDLKLFRNNLLDQGQSACTKQISISGNLITDLF